MTGVGEVTDLLAAVDAFSLSWPGLVIEPDALTEIQESLRRTGLVLLGEVHGVRENPLLAAELATRLQVGLALEWEPWLSAVVTALRTAAPDLAACLDASAAIWGGDGRITAGHLAMLRGLPGWCAVTLIDGADWTVQPPPSMSAADAGRWLWSHRDAAMASAALAAEPGPGGVLVVAGNAHTELEPIEPGVPLGAVLAAQRPGLRAITVVYGEGGSYNFGPAPFTRPWWQDAALDPAEPCRLFLYEGRLLLAVPSPSEAVVPHRPERGQAEPAFRAR